VSLRRHLLLAFLAFALALLAATLVPFAAQSARSHLASYVDQQLLDAQQVAATLPAGAAGSAALAARFPPEGQTAAWLLDPRGAPVGEPTDPDAFPAAITRAPELEEARRGRAVHWMGVTPAGRRLFVALPVERDGREAAVLWLSASLRPVERLDHRTWGTAVGIGAGSLAAAAVVAVALARRLTSRLEAVARGAARFAAGRLDEPIRVRGRDEIAALAATLNDMATRIDHLVRLEKDFVAAASHEIRTPLAAIRVRIDEIRSLTADPQVLEDLDEMAEEVDRLAGLVTRLLSLSAAERADASRPRPARAAKAIRDAVDRIEPLAALRSISLDLEDRSRGAVILSPPGAFEEVLFNLLDNAVKFSPEGGTVTIRAHVEDRVLVVAVRDAGPGVPAATRRRVFEPFYRAAPATPGHGLGLAISARLCDAAGAVLTLDDAPGGGTVARVRWPLAAVAARTSPPDAEASSAS
jgi:two-component system OmpR family sensor kinase